jgi:hypothetical protein
MSLIACLVPGGRINLGIAHWVQPGVLDLRPRCCRSEWDGDQRPVERECFGGRTVRAVRSITIWETRFDEPGEFEEDHPRAHLRMGRGGCPCPPRRRDLARRTPFGPAQRLDLGLRQLDPTGRVSQGIDLVRPLLNPSASLARIDDEHSEKPPGRPHEASGGFVHLFDAPADGPFTPGARAVTMPRFTQCRRGVDRDLL